MQAIAGSINHLTRKPPYSVSYVGFVAKNYHLYYLIKLVPLHAE
jgi:hypothetical protein